MLAEIGEFVGRISDKRSSTFIAAALITVIFGTFDYISDVAMQSFNVPTELHGAASATFVGLGAGFASLIMLWSRRERRRMIYEELDRLSELNHRLRNSLDVILSAHFNETDETHKKMIHDAVTAMDASLKQLIPVSRVGASKPKRPASYQTSREKIR